MNEQGFLRRGGGGELTGKACVEFKKHLDGESEAGYLQSDTRPQGGTRRQLTSLHPSCRLLYEVTINSNCMMGLNGKKKPSSVHSSLCNSASIL